VRNKTNSCLGTHALPLLLCPGNISKALTRIEANFIPASAYNQKLFELYIGKIRESYIKSCELSVARQWAIVLAQEKLEPLDSWSEVLKLSDKLKIRHGTEKNQGCPVIRTARILVSNGELVPVKVDMEYQRNLILNQLPEPFRSLVKSFWLEINGHQKKSLTALAFRILRAIIQYYKFIPVKETFWISQIETAQHFLDQLPSNGVSDYLRHLSALKRFFNWGISQNLTTVNPFLDVIPIRLFRVCEICNKEKKFRSHEKFCPECEGDQRYRSKIEGTKLMFIPKSPYNKKIYELYLKYINRFKLKTGHYRGTIKLQKFLTETEVTPFKSWTDVTLLSRKFKELYGETPCGCPIEKIGRMLQELSVLPMREENLEIYLLREISDWNINDQDLAKRYINVLRKHKRTINSARQALRIIRSFTEWLGNERYGTSLFTAQESTARDYCEKLGIANLEVHACVLSRFFRWAIREKLAFINPFAEIKISKRLAPLQICDDERIRQFERFLKHKDSDPELALIMALVLYWGFTAKNIAWATLEILEFGQLKIILHRGELSCGNQQHRRKQILLLPTGSKWFLDLQKRYAELWHSRYEKGKKDFPLHPLILQKNGRHNRPLHTVSILKRFVKATTLATGVPVPMNVVRRTCGHVYSIQRDAGILTELGWSKEYSFHFTWRPRRLFTSKKSKT
jgi:site-specific recombinase XerD